MIPIKNYVTLTLKTCCIKYTSKFTFVPVSQFIIKLTELKLWLGIIQYLRVNETKAVADDNIRIFWESSQEQFKKRSFDFLGDCLFIAVEVPTKISGRCHDLINVILDFNTCIMGYFNV